MLILKIVDEKPHKKSFFKKTKSTNYFKRDSFICNSTIFTVVNVSKGFLEYSEFKMFLNRFRGAVLCCDDETKELINQMYFFDSSAYYKRAFLSGLAIYLAQNKVDSLLIYDDCFRFSAEWVKIAEKCKILIVEGCVNAELKRFCDYCSIELGLQVFLNDKSLFNEKFVYADLSFVNSKKNTMKIVHNNTEKEICTDEKYFVMNSNVKKITSLGVDFATACAVVQVVPFKRIYLNSDDGF